MNLILIDPPEIAADRTVVLTDRRRDHVLKVLRSKPGDTLRAGVVNGPQGTGRVLEANRDQVVLQLEALGADPVLPPVDLILALPRPIMLQRLLAQAAALGVGSLHLIRANRVEKSFFQTSLLTDNHYATYLRHGLEQAMDTRLPAVHIHRRFRPFVEDRLPELIAGCPVRLVAHPGTGRLLHQAVRQPLRGRVLLAVGPEGGWVDFEITRFQEQGLLPFSMGCRILRVDTAVPALLGQLELLRQLGAAGPETGLNPASAGS